LIADRRCEARAKILRAGGAFNAQLAYSFQGHTAKKRSK